MGRIRVLSDPLIDRIAAGEVVERPSSVVKELVENSLDAGARSIEVEARAGGKRLLCIADDGRGMDRDDALLCLERHATSKISGAADLQQISTLGFRGEALSSIAAVSRLQLKTSVEDGRGTEVTVRGGRIESVRELGLPRGTTIRVERLFLNVPARRKFLRSDSTELSHIARLVTRYALAYPELRFRLVHEGRELLRVDPALSLGERVRQIHGAELSSRLISFEAGSSPEGVRVWGLAGRPVDALPRRDGQHLFVNGRAVQDRVLSHAVHAAYGNTVPRGRFPSVYLFVELAADLVDVNVHPQKHEVRFRQSNQIHDQVRDAIASSLSSTVSIPSFGELRPTTVAEWAPPARSGGEVQVADSGTTQYDHSEPAERRLAREHGAATAEMLKRSSIASGEPPCEQRSLVDRIHEAEAERPVRSATALVQYRDSYIVAQDRQGLLLLDQHAAHERVLFERYVAEADQNRVETQKLLFPRTIELEAHEQLLLEEEEDEFRRLGFLFEPFGGRTIRVDGVPAVAAELDPGQLLRELIGEARQARSAVSESPELRRKLVTSAACQAAIKVNYPLTLPTMQALLDDLFQVANPSTCPHGRPALFRLSLEELERAFRRR